MPTPRFPDAPPQIRALDLDPRGYPIPWFVGTNPATGERDFRIIHADQVERAVRQRCCWICGRKLGEFVTFAVGPMCAVNRVSLEPPSHLDCARFAVRACPFLTNPQARRDPRGLDVDKLAEETPGNMILRNPGVTLLWRCRRFGRTAERLFTLGAPVSLEWHSEGRSASRAEILASIASGLPLLAEQCDRDLDPEASRAELKRRLDAALELVPAA
jgi:hypothetical protein